MTDGFALTSRSGLSWLQSTKLDSFPWLLYGFSTRLDKGEELPGKEDGELRAPNEDLVEGLNLGFVSHASVDRVAETRRRFRRAVGAGDFTTAEVHQVHSALIYYVGRDGSSGANLDYHPAGAAEDRIPKASGTVAHHDGHRSGDALLTAEAGILLSVRTADCLPVLLVDPRRRAVGAVHAGWRGALARIVEKSAGEMRRVYGSNLADLVAVLGPSIRACCYEVGQEVVEAFEGQFASSDRFFTPATSEDAARPRRERYPLEFLTMMPPGHGTEAVSSVHLDLVAVARQQLLAVGVRESNIAVSPYCTACRTDLFYSHRKDGPRAGRMMSVIGIRP